MSVPFACDMLAIPPDQRAAHHSLVRRLISEALEEISEEWDGFALRFAADEYDNVVEFVSRERLCCPFLRFTLEVTPTRGPLRLRLTGPDGVKPFIQAELKLPHTDR